MGREGYTRVMRNLQANATHVSAALARTGRFDLLSDGSQIPVFAVALKDSSQFSVFDLSDKLRERGWQVPAYTMPPNAEDVEVLRFVIREGFSRDMADMLLEDVAGALAHFDANPPRKPKHPATQFSH